MAIFYLVRHGSNDYLGRALAGRTAGVHLNEQGRIEAGRIAAMLAAKGINRIISSPLERARETAAPLAEKLRLPIEINDHFLEIDFGDWTGCAMAALDASPAWKSFNCYRSGTRIPNGETMLEVQSRVVAGLEKLRSETPRAAFAIFSHGDPIKSAIAYYLGVPLDLFTRIETTPGGYSILRLEDWGPEILGVNICP
jgi:broad specificity phosphatase PhoE